MRRREVLQGLFCLSATGILFACREPEKSDHDESSRASNNPATLKVIIQGPFAVVLKSKDNRYSSVSAFIPPDPAHEFRFQTPMSTSVQKGTKYEFNLEVEGLEVSNRRPYIDHGLDDMTFELGAYREADYFVSVNLPVPDLITYIPPSEPVVFQGGRIALAPLNHVLEYRIRNVSKVSLRSQQFKEAIRPLGFSQMFKDYQQHGEREHDYKDKPGHGPQFPRTRNELARSGEPEVYTYFFGVGPTPGYFTDMAAVQHGLEFFNKKLVPLFPNSRDLKPLAEIRNYGDPCTPTGKTYPSSLKPAVLSGDTPKPRLLLVTSAEDCRAPGILGGCC